MAVSLADQLKAVKLKKTEGEIKDYSDPKLAGFMCESEVKQYETEVLDVNTETWFHILKEYTFDTKYCPISLTEAELFIKIYETNFKNQDQGNFETICWQSTLSQDESTVLTNMTQRLEKVMKRYTDTEGHVFVKTSSRSAKDAPMYQKQFATLYNKELSRVSTEEKTSENVQIICLLKAAFQALKMTSAEQVIDTFVTSERIYQDMLLAVKQRDRFHENFVVRQFVEIDVDMEFRGFVFHGELNALSQYNYLIYSEELLKKKKWIADIIQTFYDDKIWPKLKTAGYTNKFIIDFAVCKQGSDVRLWVIEINPFMPTTDGALFSWEHERHILEGKAGFCMRVTEKPKPGAKAMLPQSVRSLLKP